ncbi:hypothetical protein FJT64_021575 [Amphibalanus amphitrite]|uniref:Uncharacterized protein n=1 Tax=Amphibalanus amphitrite TaxID=1232801 RepID=A0A6A4WHQ9_AMPAM|nr:hypothetical protein FJT64_021575 [Amphibalanus amphitrite]
MRLGSKGPRTRPWGPLPTLREILSTEAGLIRDFLVETGRVTRDDMLKKKKKKKHRPEDATESVFSEDESESRRTGRLPRGVFAEPLTVLTEPLTVLTETP